MDPQVSTRTRPFGALARYARSFYELLGNRRKSARLPASGRILATAAGSVVTTTHECAMIDVSLHGMAIECSEPLPPDIILQLRAEDDGPMRLARVCYCVPRGTSYRIGVRFTII